MACEVKYNPNHHAGADADARIKSRLRPSNDTANADSVTTVGHSPTRTVTTTHLSGSAKQHGSGNPGEGDIQGNKRGVV
jgi:hypothetical protein